MACVLNLFVLSLTFLATLTVGSKQFQALKQKIDALEVMMDVQIEMIKQDLAMVVKNLTMSVIGQLQGKNGNVDTLQIANIMGEDPKSKIQATEYVCKVIQRGFSSEKMALKKSFSMIEQSVARVQSQLEDVKEDLADIARNFINKSETLTQLQLINAEISRNKYDIEAKVEKAKQDAIADIGGRVMTKSETLTQLQLINAEITRNKNNIEAKVEKAKQDAIVDINGRVMTKSETLTQLQLINAEISRNKNNIEAKVEKAKQDAIADINGRVMTKSETLTQLQLINAEISRNKNDIEAKVVKAKQDAIADINGRVMTKSETLTQLQLINAEISRNKNDIEAKFVKAKQDAVLKSNEDCKASNIKFNGELSSLQTNFMKIVNVVKKDLADINGRVMTKSEVLAQFQLLNSASFRSYKYGNSIYFKLNGTMTCDEGLRRCKQYGAHLPEVTTSKENEFLISTFGQYILLGATDKTTEGRFVWENTGQAVEFQDWAPGEPNDTNGGGPVWK